MGMKHIVMLGSGRGVKGGISSVVNNYFCSPLPKIYNLYYIPTHIDGNKFIKLNQFVKSFFIFIVRMLTCRVDIVHIHSASRASFYRKSVFILFSKLFRKNIILHIHGGEFGIFYHQESGRLKKWYIRKFMRLADVVIALSSKWKESLGDIMGGGEEIEIIPNPVALPDQKRVCHRTDITRILFMGKLDRGKGIYDLIEAAKTTIPIRKDLLFVICGDGKMQEIRRLLEESGLNKYFLFPGWVEDKEKYFQEADIFILPSYNEGLPMCVLEAAAFGLPIISTPVGGIGEVIEDGVNGFLIAPGDIDGMREKILQLASSRELCRKMGEKAFNKVSECFNLNRIVEQLDKIYQEL